MICTDKPPPSIPYSKNLIPNTHVKMHCDLNKKIRLCHVGRMNCRVKHFCNSHNCMFISSGWKVITDVGICERSQRDKEDVVIMLQFPD